MPRIGMEPVRRKALISAAIDAIHDRGMGQVTMGEIARRAGVSAALAHHYFGGKDQLLLATMRHLLTELGEEVQTRLAAASTPRERLSASRTRAHLRPRQRTPSGICPAEGGDQAARIRFCGFSLRERRSLWMA